MFKSQMSLITVALEVARDQIVEIPELLEIVKNDMTKHLYQGIWVEICLGASSRDLSLI